MKLNVDSITRLAAEVATAHSFPVRVMASVSTGASNYVEILLQLERGDAHTLTQLGVFRDVGIDDLRERITNEIRQRVSLLGST